MITEHANTEIHLKIHGNKVISKRNIYNGRFLIKVLKLSTCTREPELFAEPQPARPVMTLPTPQPTNSAAFSGLRDLVQKTAAEPANIG